MTHTNRGIGRRWLLVLPVLALHGMAWWLASRPPAKKPEAGQAVWIQAATVANAPLPPLPRPSRKPGPSRPGAVPIMAVPIQRLPPPDRPGSTEPPPALAGAASPEALVRRSPLDLSPEALGLAIRQARGPHQGSAPMSWRAERPDTPGPTRMVETTGASGSRVTRVETAWSTWCIRSPSPGRPPPSGAGPEPALPTNCP